MHMHINIDVMFQPRNHMTNTDHQQTMNANVYPKTPAITIDVKAMITDGRLIKGPIVNGKQVYHLDRAKLGMSKSV